MSYPRGSEWSKWDLHVHTPLSIVQEFGGDTDVAWDAYIAKIAALPPEIKVLGITDYLFVDGYEKLLERRDEIGNIELLMPNVEFRLNTFSGTANNIKRHNFHVIFSPEVPVNVIKEQLLNGLSTAYLIDDQSEWNQAPTVTSLEELGARMKRNAPADNGIHAISDLRAGFNNITYDLKDILRLLNKDPFKNKYITALGYTEWSQGRWDQSAAEKRNLINTVDISLTANDNLEEVNNNIAELVGLNLNHKVFHSSDAHELNKVGETKSWVKADPTFAGFKQVLNEPDHRKFIGDTPPNHKYDHQVITKVKITDSNGWFPNDFEQELNSELVSVIGPRGSGKSALAEFIAFGAGTESPVVEDSFIKKANQHQTSPVDGSKVTLSWKDGSTTTFTIGTDAPDQDLVRYLSQGAVEKLCDPANTADLVDQIEDVVFQSLDETERRAAPSFAELKAKILKRYEHQKDEIRTKIQEANKKITEIEESERGLPDRQEKLKEIQDQVKKLNDTLPELGEADLKGQEELSKLKEFKEELETGVVERTNAVNDIEDFALKLDSLTNKVTSIKSEADELLVSVGSNSEGLEFKVEYDSYTKRFEEIKTSFKDDVKCLKTGTKEEVAKVLSKKPEDLPCDNLKEVDEKINETIKKTRSYETAKKKYQEQKQLIADLEKRSELLSKSIIKTEEESTEKLSELRQDRIQLFTDFFGVLGKEIEEMETLYKPLQTAIGTGASEVEALLKFSAKSSYKIANHSSAGLNLIDRTKRGNFRAEGQLESRLADTWEKMRKSNFDAEVVKAEISAIEQSFKEHSGEQITIDSQLKGAYTAQDIYDWLFDITPYEVTSSITFDDTDLHLLSPGQKGIVLLKLYLEIDKNDTRPLIIDQPEENLDNHSIVTELNDYFKERKLRRQIILVTHNPNLVVNTDSEQVIIASFSGANEPRLTYVSGSLENHAEEELTGDNDDKAGIIEKVCSILEGGGPAFSKRNNKYLISPHNPIR